MAEEILAAEVAIEWNGKVIAAANSYSLEINGEEIDVSTLSGNGWKKILPGTKSWSGSIDGIVKRGTGSAFYDFLEHMVDTDNAAVTIALKLEEVDGDRYLSGSVVLTGLSKSGSNGEVITWSASYSGNDKPTINTYTVV
jgi:predicted secreted protein